MTDILVTKIHNTFETYTQNIRPFLSGVLNHVHGIENLDKTTLTDLLEQATDHTEVFQQNFDVNGYNFLKRYTQDNRLINLFNGYELFLNVVRATFAFAQELEIDKGDYPVPRTLRESEEKLASCYKSIQQFLVLTQPSTTGTMISTQIETEEQATQDNTPPTPSDTARHPMAYPDTKLDFEHDPELDSEDQNILAIETTDTLDNSIDNSDPTFDNSLDSSINDCTDTKQTVDNSDIGDPNESETETIDDNMQDQTDNIATARVQSSERPHKSVQFNNQVYGPGSLRLLDYLEKFGIDVNSHHRTKSHKESKPIESEEGSDSKSFESEGIDFNVDFEIDSDVGSEHDFENLETMRLQHEQEIRTMDFGPNLHTQTSECADIHAIKSNNLTCLNCKYPDHLVEDCPEPNKMQQPQSNNRKNSSIESAIEAPTQTLKTLLSNQKSHGYSKPKQPFHHKRVKPHARPSFKPTCGTHDNKGQQFTNNRKYQKQTAHTNTIEDYAAKHKAMYLNMGEIRARIPARKPIPLFSFG